MKKLIKFLTTRLTITCLFILIQLVVLFFIFYTLSNSYVNLYLALFVISLGLVVAIINDDSNPTFKMAWIIPMLIFPTFGAPLYLIFARKNVSKRIKKKFQIANNSVCDLIPQCNSIFSEIEIQNPLVAKQFKYIFNTSQSPVFAKTQTEFLPIGESFFKQLLIELEKAQKFIFLEYFIICKGKMWDSVLEILARKAKQGLDIRLMYDDFGTIKNLDRNYPKQLNSLGIKTCIFNPFHASLDAFLNYRDHRKITIIDGNVGFTGGINLADEYINSIERFGHWKDCSIIIKGDAVSRLTVMFLQLWYYSTNEPNQEYERYLSQVSYEDDGYVQPFADSPMSEHLTGELAYMNLINNATKYVYISTPYLILDNEMMTALRLAVESGIDVRIVTPFIPDKWYIHAVTRSNYQMLLKSGVKIYEYTPGFIHSKTIVVDDELAIVGTTNFDFRSFYLHFENGVFMYKSKCVLQVKNDYVEVLEKCKEITLEIYQNQSVFQRFLGKFLKLFSPMM